MGQSFSPVGCDGSGSMPVRRPSSTTATQPQREALRTDLAAWSKPFDTIVSRALGAGASDLGRLDAVQMIFNRLTGLDISLWIPAVGRTPDLISTLQPTLRNALLEENSISTTAASGVHDTLRLEGSTYQVLLRPLSTTEGAPVNVLLQRSVEEAMRPFHRLELQILGLSSAALLAALVAAVFLARGVSRPLLSLAEGARRIENGDYGIAIAYSSVLIVVMVAAVLLIQLVVGQRRLGRRGYDEAMPMAGAA